jgi:hypothetical protein
VILHSVVSIDVLEESIASISRVDYPEDGGSKFL